MAGEETPHTAALRPRISTLVSTHRLSHTPEGGLVKVTLLLGTSVSSSIKWGNNSTHLTGL